MNPVQPFVQTGEGRLRLERGVDILLRHHFDSWRYGDSVAFEGLLAAADTLGNPEYAGFVHRSLGTWASQRESFKERDDTAPGHAMCLICERTGDRGILQTALRLARFLAGRRIVEGAFVSFERSPIREPFGGAPLSMNDAELLREPGAGIFLNHLHFGGAFFSHLGVISGEPGLSEIAAQQTLAHLALLQGDDGLLWHFWLEKTRKRYGHAWGRGQTWAMLGLIDTLTYLPPDHRARIPLQASLLRLADRVAALQDSSGGWRTVMTDPDAPLETSSAAFAAAAFARGVRLGLLAPRFAVNAARAWGFAWSHVDDGGVLIGVSVNVGASTVASHYTHTPFGSMVTWGQGPLLLAAKEISESPT
jgi:unsaturated rhamnogalacturonyl hydrolase